MKGQVKRRGVVEGPPTGKPSRHGERGLQFLEFRVLCLLYRRMVHFDAAGTRRRRGVNWRMIRAHEPLVEALLLELLQFRFEFVLRAGVLAANALSISPTRQIDSRTHTRRRTKVPKWCVPRHS